MKALIAIALVAALLFAARSLVERYQKVEKEAGRAEQDGRSPSAAPASSLTGMPAAYEPALAAAQKQGAAGLRAFLQNYGRMIRDPRLADIELDYVVLLSRQDPAEARRVFNAVKARTLTSSPVYERIKRLENSFQ